MLTMARTLGELQELMDHFLKTMGMKPETPIGVLQHVRGTDLIKPHNILTYVKITTGVAEEETRIFRSSGIPKENEVIALEFS